MMEIPSGFLKETFDMLCERYPRMNKDYLFAISEITLSSACWNVYVLDEYGALAPNIWVQMIAPSGDGKSLPIDYFLIPTLDELEKMIETDDKIFKLYISDYTKEGILRHFSGRTKRKGKKGKKTKQMIYIYGLLCKDEATMFIEAATKKNYMADIVAVESKMYDGKLYRKITAGRGLEEVPKCFKANIAATTPAVYTLMKIDAFIQGGWNRYDMIVGNPLRPEEVERYTPEFFLPDKEASKEFGDIPYHWAEKLSILNSDNKIRIMLVDEIADLWTAYEQKCKLEAIKLKETDLRRGYLQRQAEKALKRAALYEISSIINDLNKFPTSDYIDRLEVHRVEKIIAVRKQNMEKAIANQETYYQYWLKMLEERGQAASSNEVKTDANEIEYFDKHMEALSKKYGIFSHKLIIEATQWKDGDKRLTTNIDTAIERGKLHRLVPEQAKLMLMKKKSDKDWGWFRDQDISTNFRRLPLLYYWGKRMKEVDDN